VTTTLIDDHVLGRWLTDSLAAADRRALRGSDVFTTGCWYYRLCHAIRSDAVIGALSGPFDDVPPAVRVEAVAALARLPESIGLTSLRALAPLMAELVEDHPLNLLALEALAAATHLGATVVVDSTNRSPALLAALNATGLKSRVV